jgi:hypothetical protein
MAYRMLLSRSKLVCTTNCSMLHVAKLLPWCMAAFRVNHDMINYKITKQNNLMSHNDNEKLIFKVFTLETINCLC